MQRCLIQLRPPSSGQKTLNTEESDSPETSVTTYRYYTVSQRTRAQTKWLHPNFAYPYSQLAKLILIHLISAIKGIWARCWPTLTNKKWGGGRHKGKSIDLLHVSNLHPTTAQFSNCLSHTLHFKILRSHSRILYHTLIVNSVCVHQIQTVYATQVLSSIESTSVNDNDRSQKIRDSEQLCFPNTR